MLRDPIDAVTPTDRRHTHAALTLGACVGLALLLPSLARTMPAPGDSDPADALVSENTGAAQLRIPIDVPPGPGGFAPQLALTYSSHAGDGPFGVGWNINLGEIRCSARFGVPDYASCPQYELDGQLLTYNAAQSRYHTFVESFREIKFISATSGWVANSPDGTILRYGSAAADSRIAASGQTARWLLSEVEDPFQNKILITYSSAPDTDTGGGPALGSDLGTAYPADVTYASGDRSVHFVYAPRLDPLHDFAGGIERKVTRRLKEIQVKSYNAIARRYVFGYDVPGVTYATGRSRLSWVREFGGDCSDSEVAALGRAGTDTATPPGCTALAAREFEYADPRNVITTAAGSQWLPDASGFQPPVLAGPALWPVGFATPVRFGDVNGDALPDYVVASAEGLREVFLNTGSSWMKDTTWSAALNALTFQAPQMNLTWTSSGEYVCAASPTQVDDFVAFDTYGSSVFRGRPQFEGPADGQNAWYRLRGSFHLVDLDADGRADLVMSARLSGIHVTHACDGTPLQTPLLVGGATVQVAFRNTGNGWDPQPAPSLTQGLPLFDMVMFENPWWLLDTISPPPGGPFPSPSDVCIDLGLWPIDGFSNQRVLCVNSIRLVPSFQELDGDGRLDLIVADPQDPTQFFVDNTGLGTLWAPPDCDPCSVLQNFAPSHAWLRGEGAWIRAEDFDLPFSHIHLAQLGGWFGFHANYPFELPASLFGDAGVRLADLNRDGYSDLVWTDPFLLAVPPTSTFVPALRPGQPVGVLLNRGRGERDGAGNRVPYSAWCSSRPLTVYDTTWNLASSSWNLVSVPNLGACPEATRYEPPSAEVFARMDPLGGTGTGELRTDSPGLHLADLNGDGWIDLVRADEGPFAPSGMQAWLHSPGASGSSVWVPDPRFDPPVSTTAQYDEYPTVHPQNVVLVDANGDGASDFAQGRSQGGTELRRSFLSRSRLPDLLREYRNGQGAVIQFAYKTAARQRDATLESAAAADSASLREPLGPDPAAPSTDDALHWTRQPVVDAVTVDGPSREPATTAYAYAHPRWDPAYRAGLGFRLLTRRRPDGSVAESYFYQKHGRAGRTSKLLVKQGASVLFRHEEVWDLPTHLIPGSLVHPDVHVGRLKKVCSANQYGGTPGADVSEDCSASEFGSELGAFRSRTVTYDDAHGYNFVSQILDTRPTGTLCTVQTPESTDTTPWLVRLVATRQEKAGCAGAVLSDVSFTYTNDRVATRTDWVQRRDGSTAEPTSQVTSYAYDDVHDTGNLKRRTEVVSGVPRVTEFCYDGDSGCTSPVGQDSHSVLVGIRDPLGKLTTLTPDAATGSTLAIDSPYTDEPTIRRELDPFGRLKKEYATPAGASEFLRTEIVYHDDVAPPYVERKDTVNRWTASSPVTSVIVSDGFGGTWKTVEETLTPTDQIAYVGAAVYRDPASDVVRETHPIACGNDATCSALTGQTETPATITTSDALGRPEEIVTPDGTSLVTYSHAVRDPPGPVASLDAVLLQNAKGDLTRRLFDGDRLVWVDECNGLAGTDPCGSADQTFYAYEATGELAAVTDPGGNVLAYHYDTLGRVRQIDDPDGGTSLTDYDEADNVISTRNARNQTTSFQYDPLDRLKRIDYPSADLPRRVEITYRSVSGGLFERQRERERGLAADLTTELYYKEFAYDDMGRVSRKTLHTAPLTSPAYNHLLLDFQYDELGRPTTIRYPDDNTYVRYEYDRGYLKTVCELTSFLAYCGVATTTYVSNVDYDTLGRPWKIYTPAGTRTYTYESETQRLSSDQFVPPTSGLYSRTLSYASYDPLGNILNIAGSSSTNDVDFSATYSYDRRNRLSSWSKPGVMSGVDPTPLRYFNYDELGNLIGNGVTATTGPDSVNQQFGQPPLGQPVKPHAVNAKTDAGRTFEYDLDGNLRKESWSGVDRYFTFDSQNRMACVGTAAGACNTLEVDYDAGGFRIREYDGVNERKYADEFYTQDGSRGDFHIYAFGEQIAYKRKVPVSLRTAGILVPPWGDVDWPAPLTVALFAALGLAGLGVLAVRLNWTPGLREEPALGALALGLVVVLVVPPLPAQAGGGGGGVMYRRWILGDHLGSATVVLNPDGSIERETVYAPFGAIHDDQGAHGTDTEVFAGHPREPTTGLHYMQARWQNPTTGSFLSVDPIVGSAGDPQAYNAYSYVRGNPVRFTDPSGMGCFLFICYAEGVWQFKGGWGGGGGGASPGPSIVPIPIDPGLPGPGLPSGGGGIILAQVPAPGQAPPLDPGSQSGFGLGDAALIAGGFVPGVGEALDAAVLADPSSTGFERGAAGASLAINIFIPFLPNFGGIARVTTDFVGDATVISRGKVLFRGTADVRATVEGIQSGALAPRNVFRNSEGLLPSRPQGYYQEFVHPTPGVSGVGPQRIIQGRGGELHYTPDHYQTFIPLN